MERQLGTRHALAGMTLVVALIVCGIAAGSGALYRAPAAPGHQATLTHRTPAAEPHRGANPAQGRPRPLPQTTQNASPPTWLWALLSVVAASATLVALQLRRGSARSAGADSARSSVGGLTVEHESLGVLPHAGVVPAVSRLEAVVDPREAVLRCWLALEQAADRLGAPRAPSETSAELTRRLLGLATLDARLLDELHAAYQLARFSLNGVGEMTVVEACSALATLQDQLARLGNDPVASSRTPR